MQQQQHESAKGGSFPFKLEDLKSWTVRRTDGTTIKFTLTTAQIVTDTTKKSTGDGLDYQHKPAAVKSHTQLSSYCNHIPKTPLFELTSKEREEGALALYVGSLGGARQEKDGFDFVIDGGSVFSVWQSQTSKILDGDEEFVRAMSPYVVDIPKTRIFQIDWDDRRAPNVIPQFWTELNKMLHGDVMTCCQGGHGRSGTAFVCLLLNNAPDYDAYDAIVHLRAVHCPRAIESVDQHHYIDDVATYLGREANSLDAVKVSNYMAAFKESVKPTAVRTRKILGW